MSTKLRNSPLLGRNDPALDRELRKTARVVNALVDSIGSGGGSGSAVAVTSVEIDLGSVPRRDFRLTITDPAVTATSKVVVWPNGTPATGRGSDDWQWDGATLTAKAGAGQFTLYAKFDGRVVGKRNIFYQVN